MKKWVILFLFSFGCAACGSSPEPDYYMLAPVEGAAVPTIKESVKIQRPQIARYLDRPDFVRQDNVVQLEIDQSRFWAEPLDVMIERTLAVDLRQRLPSSEVTTEAEDMPGSPHITVDLDIQHFNAAEPGHVILQAQITLHGKMLRDQNLSQTALFEAKTSSSGTEEVEALSTLVGQLADKVVDVMNSQDLQLKP